MSSEEPGSSPSILDRLVETGLQALAALGVNTTRLRWKWNRARVQMEQRQQDAANRFKGVTGRHRMCPTCRALVPAGSRTCSECGAPLAGTGRPGLGRLFQWILPGIPPVSAALVTANFALFVLIGLRAGFEPMSGGGLFGMLFSILSFSGDTLTRYGSGNNYLLIITGSATVFLREEWWRLVVPIFLHGGLVHLLFNTYIFAQIAPLMEEEYGRDKFLVLYLSTGIGSFVTSEILRYYLPLSHPFVNTVGASGAIFGLVGAALIYGIRRGGHFGASLRSMMIQWTIWFLVLGFLMRGTDNWAHIGGLASGAGFAALFSTQVPGQEHRTAWRLAAVVLVALAVTAILFAGLYGLDSLERLRQVRDG